MTIGPRNLDRAILALTAVALAAWPLAAQNAGLGAAHPFHTVGLSTGATTMTVDALNARLSAAQFSGLSNDAITLGAGGHLAVGRAMLGAELHRARFGEEGLANGRTDNLDVWHSLFTAAYAIVSTRALTLFPSLGVGQARLDLRLRDAAGANTTASSLFDEILRLPGPTTALDGRTMLYSVGAGADYLVTGARSQSLGVVFSVRGGVLLSPNRTTWTRDGQDVDNGPDAGPRGPFVRVFVGVGRR